MQISSIGDLIEYGYSLAVHCNAAGCGNHKQLDLPALGERIGMDHSYLKAALAPKLKCSQCGGREISFTVSKL